MTKRPVGDKTAKSQATSETAKTADTKTAPAKPAEAKTAQPSAKPAAGPKPAEAAKKPAPAAEKAEAKPAPKPEQAAAGKPADKAAPVKKPDAKVIDAKVVEGKAEEKKTEAKKPTPPKKSGGGAAAIAWVAVLLIIVGGLGYGTRHLWWSQGEPVLQGLVGPEITAMLAPGANRAAPEPVTPVAPVETATDEPVQPPVSAPVEAPSETVAEEGVEEVTETAAAVEATVEAVADTTEEVVDQVVAEVAEEVSEEIGEAAEAAEEVVEEVVADVAEEVTEVAEAVEEAVAAEVAEEVAEAAADTVAPVEVAALPADLDQRLGALEEGFARMESVLTRLEAQLGQNASASADLEGRIGLVENVGQQALDALTEEKAALEAELAALTARLDAVETGVADVEGRVAETAELPTARKAHALNLAIGQLRQAILVEGPYTGALATLQNLEFDDEQVQSQIAVLAPHATSGVKVLPSLQLAFDGVASAAARARLAEHDESVLDSTWANLKSMVSLRRTDGVEDTSVEGRIANAERAVDEGDLDRAVAEMSKLEGKPASAAAVVAWLADAKGRLAVDAAVAALTARSIELLGGGE